MKTRILPLAIIAVALGGCDSSPTAVTAFNGALTFIYTGGGSSSQFVANGTRPTTQTARETSQWAHGLITANNEVIVTGAAPRSASSHDYVEMWIAQNTVGTATIDPGCVFNCTGLYVEIGVTNGGVPAGTQSCYLTSGSVTIATLTSTRVTGSFSGSGTCGSAGGPSTSWSVSGGTFDVSHVNNASS